MTESVRDESFEATVRALFGSQHRGADLDRAAASREGTVLAMGRYIGRLVRGAANRETAANFVEHWTNLPVVHVTGTKGKGSTCAFVESVLREQGHRTGLFTSPHLVRVTERFRVNGVPVADSAFVEAFWEVWDALHVSFAAETAAGAAAQQEQCTGNDHGSSEGSSRSSPAQSSATAVGAADGAAARAVEHDTSLPLDDVVPGYFRLITLVALWLFAKLQVSVAVVEVGCGGRFDATNVIGAAFPPLDNSARGVGADGGGGGGVGDAGRSADTASASSANAGDAKSIASAASPTFRLVYPLNKIWNSSGIIGSDLSGSSHTSSSANGSSITIETESSPPPRQHHKGWRLGRIVAAGVTTLDLDHMQTLGDTLTAIAWEKGGVFKVPGAACIVTPQPADCAAAEVLRLCATEIGHPLSGAAATALNGPASPSALAAFIARCPKTADMEMSALSFMASATGSSSSSIGSDGSSSNDSRGYSMTHRRFTVVHPVAPEAEGGPKLGLSGNFQRTNAALAIALVACVPSPSSTTAVASAAAAAAAAGEAARKTLARGLANARWPGRCHTLPLSAAIAAPPPPLEGPSAGQGLERSSNFPSSNSSNSSGSAIGRRVRWHLDCAHTPVSAAECLQWYLVKTQVQETYLGGKEGVGRAANNESRSSSSSSTSRRRQQPLRVLVFNCSHEKDVAALVDAFVQDRSTCTAANAIASTARNNSSSNSNGNNKSIHGSSSNTSGTHGLPAFDLAVFCPAGAARPSRHRQPTAKQLLKSYADGVGAGPFVVDSTSSSSNSNTDDDDDSDGGSSSGGSSGGNSRTAATSTASLAATRTKNSKKRVNKKARHECTSWRLAHANAVKTPVPEVIDPWAPSDDADNSTSASTTTTMKGTTSNALLGLEDQSTSAPAGAKDDENDEARSKDALAWQRTLAHVWLGLKPQSSSPQPPCSGGTGTAAAAGLFSSEVNLPSVAVAPNLRAAFHWITTTVAAHVAAHVAAANNESSASSGEESRVSSSTSSVAAPSKQEQEVKAEESRAPQDKDEDLENVCVEVLVVGSVYLAGTALALLAPGSDGVNPG